MEAAMQELLAAGDLDLSDLPDCCNDAATVAATGQLCPSGVDGVAPPVLAPGTVTRLSLASPTAAPPPWLRAGVFDAPETDLWRPPNHA